MTNKFFTISVMLVAVLTAMAIPAKRGIWKTLPLDGVPVEAQLQGDEHLHFWLTADGQQLSEQDGSFVLADMASLQVKSQERRTKAALRRHQRLKSVRRNDIGDFTHYSGQKKGLIILVEFSNMTFSSANDSLLYTRICNEENFSEGNFRGSVYDYFKAQSYGQFELIFDVVGPVQMSNTYQYYGQNVGQDNNDIRPGLMVATACQAVDSLVNYADYDWDGDGVVDQVMCIYAGQGEADGGNSSTIWPHEWELESSDYGHSLTLDGMVINTYAVANERTSGGIEGIGTICHEFSHCLGLPDMYDINYDGNFGMGKWSLMDTGSYNDNGFCPPNYTSFERYSSGWVEPKVLNYSQTISSMQPLGDSPEAYMIRNDAYSDEYYLLENRQQKGWDSALPGNGLLVLYVDYDYDIWTYNLVNTFNRGTYYDYPANDHQRCTIFRASNRTGGGYYNTSSGDPYPYRDNDSLTNTSLPAATLYHPNGNGNKTLDKGILDIARNGDGTMTFRFRDSASEFVLPDGTVFYESFNACNGRGGNDSLWSTTMASSNFHTDNEGWEAERAYGGYKCARFGNGSIQGIATTPEIEIATGAAQLSFKAAGDRKSVV